MPSIHWTRAGVPAPHPMPPLLGLAPASPNSHLPIQSLFLSGEFTSPLSAYSRCRDAYIGKRCMRYPRIRRERGGQQADGQETTDAVDEARRAFALTDAHQGAERRSRPNVSEMVSSFSPTPCWKGEEGCVAPPDFYALVGWRSLGPWLSASFTSRTRAWSCWAT